MFSKIRSSLFIILLSVVMSPLAVYAQFNPQNPEEPGRPVFYYHVSTSCEQNSDNTTIAWTSGDGDYAPGQELTVGTSLYNDQFTFTHWTWTVGGKDYTSTEWWFSYTMTAEPVHFVAHYKFTPTSPDDPSTVLKSRLYLSSLPEGVASFSHGYGERMEVGAQHYIYAYANQGYRFKGWYVGEERVSEDLHFWYTMPNADTHLVARFVYDPDSPVDPDDDGSLDHTKYTTGDINDDGNIDDKDLQLLTDRLLNKPINDTFIEKAADMNHDGILNAQDIAILTKIILKK